MPPIIERIRHHLANPKSQHRQIVSGFLWVSAFVLLGKIAGAAKEMTIAWRYGVSATVDAYVFVYNIVSWPISVWFSILTVVLLPMLAQLRNETSAELPRFRAELLGLTILLGVLLGILLWMSLPYFLSAAWLGLPKNALNQALYMAKSMALLPPLGAVICLFSVWLLAGGHHRNTLFEAIPAFILTIALLLPSGTLPDPLLWGTVTGFIVHAIALTFPLYLRGEISAPRFSASSPVWQFFWASIGITTLGQILSTLTTLIDQFYAVGLGEGALSTLSYANRILALISGLGATAISRATLPVFSKELSQGGSGITELALRWTKWMFAFAIIVSIISWTMAPWIVSTLFERGAFTAKDGHTVTSALRYALLQIVFYFPALVLVSALAAQRRYYWIATSGALNLVTKLILTPILVNKFGISGLIVSTAIMYALSASLLYIAARHPLIRGVKATP